MGDKNLRGASSVLRVESRISRSEHFRRKPTSYIETLIHLLKGNVGAGLFAMGDAFHNAGLVLAPSMTVVIGFICLYSQHLIVMASNFTKEKYSLPASPNYPETIDIAFETGPSVYKKAANSIRRTVKVITILTQLGFCTVYVIISAELTQLIFHTYGIDLEKRIFMLAYLLPVVLTCVIRSLKFLTPISLIATFILFLSIILTLYVSCLDLPPLSSRPAVVEVSRWPLFFGTVIYAFEAISLVIPLKNEMKNERLFYSAFGVLNVGTVIYTGLMVTIGTIGYLKYGAEVKAVLSLNIAEHILSTPVQVLLIIGILLSYALQFYVGADMMWNEIDLKWGPFKNPNACEISFRIGLVLLTFLCAAVIPKLNKFISLVGAIGGTSLALLFPPLCDIGLRTTPTLPLVSKFNSFFYFMDFVSLVLAVLGFIFGTYVSTRDIIIAFMEDGLY